ncbi:hypothetical protein GCM10007079_48170 [Nocardiopsis terrae]|uniref:LPXTG-motif cell wall-anchored protein n=1 Tax=Nocardiopsis terrae TaxID=372655 RepID=A0ABR9HAL3_9ACTN|nr:LPXTG cell wall anchor domain-containing protein [Nocardiopsis terrae]MBE1456067.1 LPXTG-motif cell wall-anchored protein [Nocardiopsis terrae]GHC96050.1 hypothetical protein GCM10007079_48170 [Nocardiopsis terrae]
MKNAPRITARRVLQGGAAFAALGALSLATAMPAHADTYGWAYASAIGGQGSSETYITQEQTVSNPFSTTIGDWLVVEGTTTATVNADGATATTVIDSAKVSVTAENVEDILDPEDEDSDEDDDSDEDPEGDDLDEDETPEDNEGGDSEDGTDEGTDPEGGEGSGDPSEEPAEDPTEEPAEEPSQAPTEEPTGAPSDSAEVIELDEENSELVDGSETVILEGTITGITVTTTQSWDGEVSHHADEGTFKPEPTVFSGDDGEELVLNIQPSVNQGVVQTEDAGFHWNDAYTNLYMNFLVDDEFVAGYPLAESAAGITTGAVDNGDDGDDGTGDDGNGDGDEGDDKNPPQKERDEDTLPKTDPKDAQPLAQTGSPVAGLIAAGAAIAAGGGAAAYLARRRKKNDEVAETNED